MKLNRLTLLLALITLAACSENHKMQGQATGAIPKNQAPGLLLAADREQINLDQTAPRTLVFFVQNNALKELQELILEHNGSIRNMHEASGIVLAELAGADILAIEKINRAKGAASYFSAVHLSKFISQDIRFEKLNPFTGVKNEVQSFQIQDGINNHQLPIEEIKIESFRKYIQDKYNVIADGSSAKIAILDTGVDLSQVSTFQNRILVSQDITGDGKVEAQVASFAQDSNTITGKLASIENGQLVMKEHTYQISEKTQSIDGKYFLGSLAESKYAAKGDVSDINQNGSATDMIPVLVINKKDGAKVFLDTNLNGSFDDEDGAGDYSISQETIVADIARLGRVRLNVNIASITNSYQIDSTQSNVIVHIAGFDSGRHGTHVAGIAAGQFQASQFAKGYSGGAPAAKILAYRVLGAKGGSSADIIDGMIRAVNDDADVINMSLGGLQRPTTGEDEISQAVDRLSRASKSIFVIAAGNAGPNANQVGSPGTALRAITVGASVSSQTLERAYSVNAPNAGTYMWYFSSNGPLDDGRIKPTIVAPGSAISSVPFGRNPNERGMITGYDLMQGTSMASPAVAGAVAVLVDAVNKVNKTQEKQISRDSLAIERALIDGAVSLNELNKNSKVKIQYGISEQGAGLVDTIAAFERLIVRKAENSIEYQISTKNLRQGRKVNARGVYSTRPLPESLEVSVQARLDHLSGLEALNFYKGLELTSSEPWLNVRRPKTGIWSDNIVKIPLSVDQNQMVNLPVGTHTARVTARDVDNGQLEFYFDVTYVKTIELTAGNESRIIDNNLVMEPGEVRRYNVIVDQGVTSLAVDLLALAFDANGKSNPSGLMLVVSDPTGATVFEAEDYTSGRAAMQNFIADNPAPGAWEVTVMKRMTVDTNLPAQLRISATKLQHVKEISLVAKGNGPQMLSTEIEVANFGGPIKLLPVVRMEGVGFEQEAFIAPEHGMVSSMIRVPDSIKLMTVNISDVKLNLGETPVAVVMVSSDGQMISEISMLTKNTKLMARVFPGQDVAVLFYPLAPVSDGFNAKLSWGMTNFEVSPGQAKLNEDTLLWSDSTQLHLSVVPSLGLDGVLRDVELQGFSPYLRGQVELQNILGGAEQTVSEILIKVKKELPQAEVGEAANDEAFSNMNTEADQDPETTFVPVQSQL